MAEVTLRITGDARGVQIAAVDADRALDQLERNTTDRVGRSSTAWSLEQQAINQAKGALLGYVGVQALISGGREVLQQMDAWTALNGRLKLVTDSAEGYEAAQEAVLEIAENTRTELDATATLYQRVAQATENLGFTQAQVAELTETINQSFAVSNTSAAETASSIRQLGQALASGVLRGDEFNSIMENNARLAQALSDALGVTRGELRAMAEAGELTAEMVAEALLSQAGTIEKEFGGMAVTIGQAQTLVGNAFEEWIGRASDASGAAETIAGALQSLATNFDDVADSVVALAEVILTVLVARAIAAGVTGLQQLATQAALSSLTMETLMTGATRTATATGVLNVAVAGLGRGLLALVGGPIGAVVIGLTALGAAAMEVAENIEDAAEREQQIVDASLAAASAVREIGGAYQAVDLPTRLAEIREGYGALDEKIREHEEELAQIMRDTPNYTALIARLKTEIAGLTDEQNALVVALSRLRQEQDALNMGPPSELADYTGEVRNLTAEINKQVEALDKRVRNAQGRDVFREEMEAAIANAEAHGADASAARESLEEYQRLGGTLDRIRSSREAARRATQAATQQEREAQRQAEATRRAYDAFVNGSLEDLPDLYRDAAEGAEDLEDITRELSDLAERAALTGDGYANALERIQAAETALLALGPPSVAVQNAIANARGAATRALEQQVDPIEEMLRAMDDEYRLLGMTERARRQEIAVMRAREVRLREGAELQEQEADAIRAAAGALYDKEAAIDAAEAVDDRLRNGILNAFEDLGRALTEGEAGWSEWSRAALSAIDAVLPAIEKMGEGGGGFGELFVGEGGKPTDFTNALGALAGNIAEQSGGGTTGAVMGAISGFVSGLQTGNIYAAIAMAVVSAYMGYGGGDKNPTLTAAGNGTTGINGTRPEASAQTALGQVTVGTNEMKDPTSRQVTQAVQDFDRQVAAMLNQSQEALARNALRSWQFRGSGGEATTGELLESRLETIATSVLGQEGGAFIRNFSNDFQQQLQAFGDVLDLKTKADDGRLVVDTLEQALTLVTQFADAGETVGQTYARIAASAELMTDALALADVAIFNSRAGFAALAQTIIDEIGGVERATELFNDSQELLYTPTERAQVELDQRTNEAQTQLEDVGLNFADLDLSDLSDFKARFNAVMASGNPELIREWLEAASAIRRVQRAQDDYNETLDEEGGQLQALLDGFRRTANDRGLSDFARRMRDIQKETDEAVQAADDLGATEAELAEIRAEGNARAQELIDQRADELNQFLEELAFEDAIAGMSEYDRQVAQINRQTEEWIAQATELGATEEQLARIREYGANAIDRLTEAEEERAGNVVSAGEIVMQRMARLAEIMEEVSRVLGESETLEDQIAGLRSKWEGLFTEAGTLGATEAQLLAIRQAGVTELRRLLEAERDRLSGLEEQNEFRRWLDEENLSNTSTLTATQRVQFAREQFDELVASGASASEITAAAQQFLEEAREAYGDTDRFDDIREYVRGTVGVLADSVTVDEATLETLQRIDEWLEALASGDFFDWIRGIPTPIGGTVGGGTRNPPTTPPEPVEPAEYVASGDPYVWGNRTGNGPSGGAGKPIRGGKTMLEYGEDPLVAELRGMRDDARYSSPQLVDRLDALIRQQADTAAAVTAAVERIGQLYTTRNG